MVQHIKKIKKHPIFLLNIRANERQQPRRRHQRAEAEETTDGDGSKVGHRGEEEEE